MLEQTIGAALSEAAARFGDREGFTFADRRLSFREVDAESGRRRARVAGVQRPSAATASPSIWPTHSPYAALQPSVS